MKDVETFKKEMAALHKQIMRLEGDKTCIELHLEELYEKKNKMLTLQIMSSRERHPLTNKEEAEAQVKEFDKVQPKTKGT